MSIIEGFLLVKCQVARLLPKKNDQLDDDSWVKIIRKEVF